MKEVINLVGRRFGRLEVVGFAGRRDVGTKGRKLTRWECICDCGGTANVSGQSLRNNQVKSCGCLRLETSVSANTKHGGYYTRVHRIWAKMLDRCRNPRIPNWRLYGGRGIKVCTEWYSFVNFRDWAYSNGYSDELSIDRINNDGNYEPGNCRWATPKEQARNTRSNHWITIQGEKRCLSDWMNVLGVPESTFLGRISKGFSDVEALTLKPYARNPNRNYKRKYKS